MNLSMTTHDLEKSEIEYELTIDASTYGHTDQVQQMAEQAAAAALRSYENGEHGDLLLNAARAALVATNAALRALDAAGHLVPEGESVQRWVVMSRDNRPLSLPLDADELRQYVTQTGLADTDHVDTIRTIVSTIPREATRAQPAAPVGEGEF